MEKVLSVCESGSGTKLCNAVMWWLINNISHHWGPTVLLTPINEHCEKLNIIKFNVSKHTLHRSQVFDKSYSLQFQITLRAAQKLKWAICVLELVWTVVSLCYMSIIYQGLCFLALYHTLFSSCTTNREHIAFSLYVDNKSYISSLRKTHLSKLWCCSVFLEFFFFFWNKLFTFLFEYKEKGLISKLLYFNH